MAGVPVQGLTREQAQARLAEQLVPRLDRVTLTTAAGKQLALTLAHPWTWGQHAAGAWTPAPASSRPAPTHKAWTPGVK